LGFTAGLRALTTAALAAAAVLAVTASPVAAASQPATVTASAADTVVHIAEAQRGKRYVLGAAGPHAFDCSGLVLYSYRTAGVGGRLGGGHSGYAMLAWGRAHHLVSRSRPQVGDVVIYGGGAHAAIYVGAGRVISALNPAQGIRVTGLHSLHLPVTGYIHTQLGRLAAKVAKPASGGTVAATSAAGTEATLVRTRFAVHLRAGASTATAVLATVPAGAQLRVIGSAVRAAKPWDHVVYRGRSGWVRADLVRAG
jgi:NlpC/P60 family/Bacterial SH3 domain